jgi:hypothetical protein
VDPAYFWINCSRIKSTDLHPAIPLSKTIDATF